MSENSTALAVIPLSGEAIDLSQPREAAIALDRIRDAERDIKFLKGVIMDALKAEAVRLGSPKVELDGVSFTITNKTEISWDVEILEGLLELGLPQERYDQLVEIVQETKVNATVANQIAKINPEYGKLIAQARTDRPAGSNVTVTIA